MSENRFSVPVTSETVIYTAIDLLHNMGDGGVAAVWGWGGGGGVVLGEAGVGGWGGGGGGEYNLQTVRKSTTPTPLDHVLCM